MRTLNKNEAGRLIPQLRRAAIKLAESIDRRNSLLALLCLDDAFDSVGQKVLRPLVHPSLRPPETTMQEQFAVFEHVIEQFLLIFEALELVLEHSRVRERPAKWLPRIRVGIGESSPDILIDGMKKKGAIGPDDYVFAAAPELAPSVHMGEAVVVDSRGDLLVEESVIAILKLLVAVRRMHAAETAVKLNLELSIREDQPIPTVNFPPEFTLEKMAEFRNRTVRSVMDSDNSVPEWASNFKKASAEGMMTLDLGINSKENWNALMREQREVVKAFCSFKGFEESFASRLGYTVNQFAIAIECLMAISRRTDDHTVFLGERSALAKELKTHSGLSNSVVGKIIASLTWRIGRRYVDAPIINLGSQSVFSLIGVMGGCDMLLEHHFADPRYSDEVGKQFERKCREILEARGFTVYPKSIPLPFSYLPEDVSLRLWNRLKPGSDIDILARKGNYLYVLECKERKISGKKLAKLATLLSKTKIDLKFKTLWVRENHEKLRGIIGPEWNEKLLGGNDIPPLIPVLVSNHPLANLAEPDIPLLTLSELRRFNGVSETSAQDKGAKLAHFTDEVIGQTHNTMVI